MTRTYDRETIQWERADIEALVEAGRAQYFPGLPGYVIDKKLAVRNHQIIDIFTPAPKHLVLVPALNEPVVEDSKRAEAAEALVEQLQTLRHGPAENRDGEFDQESRQMVDAILNSDEAELEHSIREEIADLQHRAQGSSIFDEDALLAKFGV